MILEKKRSKITDERKRAARVIILYAVEWDREAIVAKLARTGRKRLARECAI